MRALFLTLLLANAAFFGWSQWIDTAKQPVGVAASSALPATATRLLLASEAEPNAPEAHGAGEPSEAPLIEDLSATRLDASSVAPSCLSVGPFRSLNEVATAAAALRAQGFTPRQRMDSGEVWVGHWVSWREAGSREQAEATVALLAERGITDTYILPATDSPHVVSLGVFTDRRRAERRREEVSLLGLDASISDRRQPGTVYWIDVDREPAAPSVDPAMLQVEPGRILRIETRPCPAGSTSASESGTRMTEQKRAPAASSALGADEAGSSRAQ